MGLEKERKTRKEIFLCLELWALCHNSKPRNLFRRPMKYFCICSSKILIVLCVGSSSFLLINEFSWFPRYTISFSFKLNSFPQVGEKVKVMFNSLQAFEPHGSGQMTGVLWNKTKYVLLESLYFDIPAFCVGWCIY